jgi:hypothetical protein
VPTSDLRDIYIHDDRLRCDKHPAWSVGINSVELPDAVRRAERHYQDDHVEAPIPALASPSTTAVLVFERVRTDDGGYRVFEPSRVGGGAVTYDPNYGDIGIVIVDGTLSTDLDPAIEARMCRDIAMLRGEDAVFERLEYVYRRQSTRTTRPKVSDEVRNA